MRRAVVAAALLLAVACGTDPDRPFGESPTGTTPVADPLANVSSTCTAGGPNAPKFSRTFGCGVQIVVTSSNTTLTDNIPSALAIWNTVLGHDGLPKFVTSGTASQPKVQVEFDATSGPFYCGDTGPVTTDPVTNAIRIKITVHRSLDQTKCEGELATNPVQSAGLPKLIAHELSHALGFDHLSQLGSPAASANCVAALPPGGGLNGSLCQHEILLMKYSYNMYPSLIALGDYIVIGLAVTGVTSAKVGDTPTLTAEVDWEVAPTTTPRFTWTSQDPTVASVSPTTTENNTVSALKVGTTIISVRLSGTGFVVLNPSQGDVTFTVNPPPPPPPTGLNATAITYNSATIRWTAGAPDATTNLYYRKNGVTTWTDSITGIPEGTTSRQITGLTGSTSYEVQAKHVRNGLSSTLTSILTFKTALAPLPTITNFIVTACNQQVAGGKTFNYFTMTWNVTPEQATGSYQIATYTANNTSLATIVTTVAAPSKSGVVGGYLSGSTLLNRWFWVRFTGGAGTTAWVPLNPNPLATNQCAL